jgi:hypothetical protein
MDSLDSLFKLHGVEDIFGYLKERRFHMGVEAERNDQVRELHLHDHPNAVRFLRDETRVHRARRQQARYTAGRLAKCEWLHKPPGNFAVGDFKREGCWRALTHGEKVGFLEAWLKDVANEEIQEIVAQSEKRWMLLWAQRIDLADSLRKTKDSYSMSDDEIAIYLVVATDNRQKKRADDIARSDRVGGCKRRAIVLD